jgi:hypothetical protein
VECRVVNAGVRWWNIQASDSVGGVLSIIPVEDPSGLYDNAIHTPAALESGNHIYTDVKSPGTYVLPHHGSTEDSFQTIITDPTFDEFEQPFGAVLFRVDGAVSSSVLMFQFVINYEVIFDMAGGFNVGTTSTGNKLAHSYMLSTFLQYLTFIPGTTAAVKLAIKHAANGHVKRKHWIKRNPNGAGGTHGLIGMFD